MTFLWPLGGLLVFLLLWYGPRWIKRLKQQVTGPNTRLPHERYPRILHWQKGDTIKRYYNAFDNSPDFYAGHAELIGLTTDGRVFLKDYEQMWELSVDEVCKGCWNIDAHNREISERIKDSRGYTQALTEFNESVRALQLRDEKNGVDLPEKYYPAVPDVYIS